MCRHQLQHRLFEVGTLVLGIAGSNQNGLLIGLGHIVTIQREGGRIHMAKAPIHAFLLAGGQRQLTEERITPIGEHLVQATPQLEAIEMLGPDVGPKQPV